LMLSEVFNRQNELDDHFGWMMTSSRLIPVDLGALRNKPPKDVIQVLAGIDDDLGTEHPICLVRRTKTFEITILDTLFVDWRIGILLLDPEHRTGMYFPASELKRKAAAIAVET